jgi:hypothetical protein
MTTLALNPKNPSTVRELRRWYAASQPVVQLGYYKTLISLEKQLILDAIQEKKNARRKDD